MTGAQDMEAASARLERLAPPAARFVLAGLHDAGYQAFAVGGCVRDALLGRTPHDWDITTDATPDQMVKALGCPFADPGVKHGTITFIVDGVPVETTTFRTEAGYSDGRHPDAVRFTRSLGEDLARRDFTVNAMAWSPETGIADPYGGARDLDAGLLRCVGDPPTRLREDGLRIMRGLRIAATYGLAVEPGTARAIHRCAEMLDAVSMERISAELMRMLAAPDGARLAAIAREFQDVLLRILPELRPLAGRQAPELPVGQSLLGHSLDLLAAMPAEAPLRLAALLHAVGEAAVPPAAVPVPAGAAGSAETSAGCPHDAAVPVGAQKDAGIAGPGPAHGEAAAAGAARLAGRAMRRLKLPHAVADEARFLIANAGLPVPESPAEADARRLLVRCGGLERAERLLAFAQADRLLLAGGNDREGTGRHDGETGQENASRLARMARAVAPTTPLKAGELAIGGEDLIARGWRQGPGLGRELGRLFELVLAGDVANDRESLLAAVGNPG